jgi:hypothetical protein
MVPKDSILSFLIIKQKRKTKKGRLSKHAKDIATMVNLKAYEVHKVFTICLDLRFTNKEFALGSIVQHSHGLCLWPGLNFNPQLGQFGH